MINNIAPIKLIIVNGFLPFMFLILKISVIIAKILPIKFLKIIININEIIKNINYILLFFPLLFGVELLSCVLNLFKFELFKSLFTYITLPFINIISRIM